MLSSQGKKLAQELGMLALPESNFICGKVGDFPISIYETPQYQLSLEVAAAPGETAPSRELEDALRMELPEFSGQFTVNQMEHGFRIATARCGYGKKLKLVGGLLGALSRYLAENRMVPCCIHCGSTEPVSLCQCGEGMAAFCEKCAGECAEALAHSAAERKTRASSIPKGILGAVIGALPGVILWLLIYRVGYLAAVCGLVMAYGAFKGYSVLGGRLDKKGVAVGTAVSLVMLVFAMMLCYAWALLDVFGPEGFGFLDCFLAVPTALALYPEVLGSFITELLMGLVLTAAGAFAACRNLYRNSNPSTVFRKVL